MRTAGTYFDGETAADHDISVGLDYAGVTFEGATVSVQFWPFASLKAVEPARAGQALRLTNLTRPGARLVVRDDPWIEALCQRAPHLRGGINKTQAMRTGGWILAGLAGAAALAYLVLVLAPQKIAFLLPETWRQRVGEQMEASLVDGAKACSGPSGQKALSNLSARLAKGDPPMPEVSVRVYDMSIMNAFALVGGRIVVTRQLIEKAGSADELAGVLAHEVGHVSHRHAEAQLVRISGLQVLASVMTGGGSDTVSSFASMAAILQFSREAEREADGFAVAKLTGANIDPMAFRNFFEILKKEEGTNPKGVLGKIGNMMSTHPVTQDRIDAIKPLPPGTPTSPALNAEDWLALRRICGA